MLFARCINSLAATKRCRQLYTIGRPSINTGSVGAVEIERMLSIKVFLAFIWFQRLCGRLLSKFLVFSTSASRSVASDKRSPINRPDRTRLILKALCHIDPDRLGRLIESSGRPKIALVGYLFSWPFFVRPLRAVRVRAAAISALDARRPGSTIPDRNSSPQADL